MSDSSTILPPAHLVHEQLTRNQRERRRLRTLLRVILEASEEDEPQKPSAAHLPPSRKEVGHED
jgi:hypothetical protein